MGNEPIEPQVMPSENNSLVSLTVGVERVQKGELNRIVVIESNLSSLFASIKPELTQLASVANSINLDARAINITTDDGLVEANQFLVSLAPCINNAESYKDAFTKTTKKQAKNIDALFKLITDKLEEASTIVRTKTVVYRRRQQEAALEVQRILDQAKREEEERKRVEFEAANPKQVYIPPTPEPQIITPPTVSDTKTIRVDNGQVSYTPKWVFKVIDMDKIPVDVLRAAAGTSRGKEAVEQIIRQRVGGGTRVMDGVDIYDEERATVKG